MGNAFALFSAGTAQNLALNYDGAINWWQSTAARLGEVGSRMGESLGQDRAKLAARINEMRLIKMQRNVTYLKLKLK